MPAMILDAMLLGRSLLFGTGTIVDQEDCSMSSTLCSIRGISTYLIGVIPHLFNEFGGTSTYTVMA